MIPELGHFAIILALLFALLPLVKRFNYSQSFFITTNLGQFIFLSFAMLCLIISFLNNDLTVLFVREHSNKLLPFIYRVGAAWGGHEGSLLLWCIILSGWTLLFTIFSKLKESYASVIQILGAISAGFIAFLLFTSNPFKRDFPEVPISGNDLIPILQDPGLIFHPPMLYLGYVGFALVFALALAALLKGKLAQEDVRAMRLWLILPWAFLSCGIVLGSSWAYRELGWGGWWFWDPVENASLLPWLSATALIHTLIVSEKCEAFYGWTLLLALITFALSLIGTFLVRSGVLVSVHAFASDPTRGIILLGYLTLLIGGAFLLYAVRIKSFYQSPNFNLLSRETFLLINSVFFLTAVATILLGTLYPIILDALNIEKISVGEPYFNNVFMPIMLPLLLLMGVVPFVKWKKQSFAELWQKLRLNLIVSLLVGLFAPYFFGFPFYWLTAFGIFLSMWIILGTLQYSLEIQKSLNSFPLKYWSMIIAHLGIAVFVLGVTLNKSYSLERQVKMQIGESADLAGFTFTFKNLEEAKGPNYKSLLATFIVEKNHEGEKLLFAEQRLYSGSQVLSKTGILINLFRDLYVALGAYLPDGAWSVRIYYKPFVRWIWCGGFMLLVGGILALITNIKIKRREEKV